MGSRPPFDPREDLRTEIFDLGTSTVSVRDAAGNWVTGPRQNRGMSVFLDGNERISCSERIDGQIPIGGDDELVAFHPCGCCDLWECNLTEGYAAKVRRLGPYIFWVTPWDEIHCFDLERYREVFGGHPERLPELSEDDVGEFREPLTTGEYISPSGKSVFFDSDALPEHPLSALRTWPAPHLERPEIVAPPAAAIELRSVIEGNPSLWIEETPGPGGHRAAFLPGVFRLPVWIAGPLVDAVIEEALGE